MKKMSKNAGLPDNKRITNTSVRKTLVQRMTDSNVPDTLQVYVTGHKNIQSLNNYRTINDTQKFAISSILSKSSCKTSSLVPFSNTAQNTHRLDTPAAATSSSTMVDVQPRFENAAIETQNNQVAKCFPFHGINIQRWTDLWECNCQHHKQHSSVKKENSCD